MFNSSCNIVLFLSFEKWGGGVGAWKVLVLKNWLSDGGATGRQLHCQSEDAVIVGICFCPESCPTVIKGNHVSGWSNVAPTHADSPKGFYNKRLQCTESLGWVEDEEVLLFLKLAGLNFLVNHVNM